MPSTVFQHFEIAKQNTTIGIRQFESFTLQKRKQSMPSNSKCLTNFLNHQKLG